MNRSFDALSHHRRRLVLYHLIETFDGDAHHDALAEIIVSESERMGVTTEAQKRALTSLTHVHLPRLAEVGFVEIDHDEATVQLQELPAITERLLNVAKSYELNA